MRIFEENSHCRGAVCCKEYFQNNLTFPRSYFPMTEANDLFSFSVIISVIFRANLSI